MLKVVPVNPVVCYAPGSAMCPDLVQVPLGHIETVPCPESGPLPRSLAQFGVLINTKQTKIQC